MHLIGMLMNLSKDDPESAVRRAMFVNGLSACGWKEGTDFNIDARYGKGDNSEYLKHAKALVANKAEAVLVSCGPTWRAMDTESSGTMKTVFAGLIDPMTVTKDKSKIGGLTGAYAYNVDFAATWLQLLKKVAPRVTTVGVIHNPFSDIGTGMLNAINSVKGSVEIAPIDARDAGTNPGQFTTNVKAVTSKSNSGLIVTSGVFSAVNRDMIINLANQSKAPTIYPNRIYVDSGGLMSYGAVTPQLYQDAADFVFRIVAKGANPGSLPPHNGSKFEFVVNHKLAAELNLNISPTAPLPGW
jgi:putative tryptophan/tyrosine transport system substrate-binding protein